MSERLHEGAGTWVLKRWAVIIFLHEKRYTPSKGWEQIKALGISVANRSKEKCVELSGKYLKYARRERLWMVLNAGRGDVVLDDVSRTLILSEHFHLVFILDVICCVKLQQLPTHFLRYSLSLNVGVLYLSVQAERLVEKEILIINPLVTKQAPNLKIKIYYQNVLIPKVKFVSIPFTL